MPRTGILSIVKPDWLQHVRSLHGVYECVMKHAQNFHSYNCKKKTFENLWYYMMHAQKSQLKGRHVWYHIFKLILLFGFIMMFDTAVFLPSFDTDYVG